MEGSAFTDATLRVFCAIDAPRNVMGIAIQAYLRRTANDVDELLKRGVRIRLVKGAYKEPPDIAFAQKRDVDRKLHGADGKTSCQRNLPRHGHAR